MDWVGILHLAISEESEAQSVEVSPNISMRVLRGAIAIVSGWIVMFAGCLTMRGIAVLIGSEGLAPSTRLSRFGIVVMFSIFYGSALFGGFVTGVIARRNEMRHAVGLVLFAWLVNGVLLLLLAGGDLTAPLVNRYTIAAQVLLLPSILAGGWLRMCQMTRSRVNSGSSV